MFRSFVARVLTKVLRIVLLEAFGKHRGPVFVSQITDTGSVNCGMFNKFQISGPIFVQHIHRETAHVSVMSEREVSDLNAILIFLGSKFREGKGPLTSQLGLEKAKFRAFIWLLSTFLRKRKRPMEVSGAGQELSIVLILMDFIREIMDGSYRVADAVEAGLVTTIRHDCFTAFATHCSILWLP
ncbi:hypothetical protein L218DRAFT_1010109 [Marasmius fiardii PR-910]|nr:hypothetical protein L218DRAFT_1010109 [Marasmius fiardii PR-910]